MELDIKIINPQKVIYAGRAKSVVVPGERGVFEVLPFHKRTMARLISGTLILDGQERQIRRGVIKVSQNHVTIIIEDQ